MERNQTLTISMMSSYDRPAKTARLVVGYQYNDLSAFQTKFIEKIGPLQYDSSHIARLFKLAGSHLWTARDLMGLPTIDTIEIQLPDFTPEDLSYLKQLLYDTPELWQICVPPGPDEIQPVNLIRFTLADIATDPYLQYLQKKISTPGK